MLALWQDQQTSEKQARKEAPDVRPPSDSGSGLRREAFAHPIRNQIPTKTIAGASKKNGKNMFWTGNILSRAPLT
jgi:hypothetical protein